MPKDPPAGRPPGTMPFLVIVARSHPDTFHRWYSATWPLFFDEAGHGKGTVSSDQRVMQAFRLLRKRIPGVEIRPSTTRQGDFIIRHPAGLGGKSFNEVNGANELDKAVAQAFADAFGEQVLVDYTLYATGTISCMPEAQSHP